MSIKSDVRGHAACLAGLALVALPMIALPLPARAGVDPEVRAGLYPEADAVSVGGGLLTQMGSRSRWFFNPNVEVAMGDRDIVALSGDVHYDFANEGNASFWVGAGPTVLVTDRPGADADTDLGLNLLTGVGGSRGNVRPFAQLRGTRVQRAPRTRDTKTVPRMNQAAVTANTTP